MNYRRAAPLFDAADSDERGPLHSTPVQATEETSELTQWYRNRGWTLRATRDLPFQLQKAKANKADVEVSALLGRVGEARATEPSLTDELFGFRDNGGRDTGDRHGQS